MAENPPYTVRNLNRQAPNNETWDKMTWGERGECERNVPTLNDAKFRARTHHALHGETIVVDDANGVEVFRLER